MSIKSNTAELVTDSDIQDISTDLLLDTIEAFCGNPLAYGKIAKTLLQSPFLIKEKIFWSKVEQFLSGKHLSDAERIAFCKKMKDGKTDDIMRLLHYIDRAENTQKNLFLVNAARSLSYEYIELSDFFRICHAVTNTLYEDLLFAKEHLKEHDLEYCIAIQGLLVSGLVFESVIGESPRYSFTPLACLLDQFSLSFDDRDRYPNPSKKAKDTSIPFKQIPDMEKQKEEFETLQGMLHSGYFSTFQE